MAHARICWFPQTQTIRAGKSFGMLLYPNYFTNEKMGRTRDKRLAQIHNEIIGKTSILRIRALRLQLELISSYHLPKLCNIDSIEISLPPERKEQKLQFSAYK